MNALVFLMMTTLAVSPLQAEPQHKKAIGLDKFLKSMFTPRTKSKAKPRKRTVGKKPEPKPAKQPGSRKIAVGPEWLASYKEQKTLWDYPIPEDDLITFKDGKYHVPLVVFKHYEDMLNTPRRVPVAKPVSDGNAPRFE